MRLYIHIPFCDSKCGYCAFFSQVEKRELIPAYFIALQRDLAHVLKQFQVQHITSIFVGGGTPNIADSKYYAPLFQLLESFLTSDCEITFEANPNLLTQSWLTGILPLGINRLSLGVQSFYTDKLQLLERAHTQKDIESAFNIAQKYLDNISLDLIYDCKLDTKERLFYELDSALRLPINHLSAYSLSIEENSRFGDKKSYNLQSNESFGIFVRDFLDSKGFLQYEVSNFAATKKCEHNLGYWRGEEYLGIGASAVGRIKNLRYFATQSIEGYIANPLQRREEHLNQKDLDFESIFMGLRSEIGVEKSLLNPHKLAIACNENVCYENHNRVYAKDFFLADSLALYLL